MFLEYRLDQESQAIKTAVKLLKIKNLESNLNYFSFQRLVLQFQIILAEFIH